ncbi:class I SAM-dependent methyltransferase [Vibrio pectenicida]|uniref:Class I SAM-dependent methyltransferase n=1 Tax=Vibrio pectenicida TaxID=62763 RepID=A0A7Y3ZX81_9VIBR|nr:class I SAM-dependent methyltransferase [Vibrio pectenicida]NOH70740.1 class I SAM-dependent methyltransferase [Vibrio pectenicida]
MSNERFKVVDSIKVIHSDVEHNHDDYNVIHLNALFSAEEKHFWFLHRKKIIYREMEKLVPLDSSIIEIGAGTGGVSQFLIKQGYNNLAVGELHFQGLKYAKSYGINDCYQFDLLRSPFEKEFNTVCMFDVLEHLSDPDLALRKVHTMLKDNGYIFLTLPAHQWLWSREDKLAGHKKRYTKRDIHDELERNGFEVVKNTYFFKLITPFLLLRRFIYPDNNQPVSESEYGDNISINPYVNTILDYVCRFEHSINSFIPDSFGGSIFVVGRKK